MKQRKMTTVPHYTYKLLNSQNQLEIGLLNHLAQQVNGQLPSRDGQAMNNVGIMR